MTELDGELPGLALELIEEFGKAVVYTVVQSGEYDPTTGTSAPTNAPIQIKAIVEEYDGQAFASGLIERGDKKLTVAAQAFSETPSSSDTVAFDGGTWTIQGVKIVYSGELPAIYELQARQ